MKIALLGLPQSGKKTLFTLLTGRDVPEHRNEGESLEGVAQIRDPRVDVLTEMAQPEKTKYAENKVVLCPDMSEGTGKRDWLDAARRCDLLCLVVRDFASESVYHPSGSVDASRDRRTLETELLLADLELIEKRLERLAKEKRSGLTPGQQKEEEVLLVCREAVENEKRVSTLGFGEEELAAIRSLNLATLMPILWILNVEEERLGTSEPAEKDVFLISALIEKEIMGIDDPEERSEYLAALGLESAGLDRLNAAAYDALGLMSFYTVGKDEVRAWTIRKGSSAPAAGGKIHSDIERGFIRVEVIKYDDLVAVGSEASAKAQGKAMLKGKDYIMEDGDICHFRFNV
ncbi:MAG: redox-regulated ATPase YchF [Geobacter sp.]|nr:MAG: redox-regulated ATPase YchF [Geobacter sp.]